MHRQRVFNDHSKAMQEIRNEKRGGGGTGFMGDRREWNHLERGGDPDWVTGILWQRRSRSINQQFSLCARLLALLCRECGAAITPLKVH